MNIELLRKIQAAIKAEPGRFDMHNFDGGYKDCGTIHCIGGWACALSGVYPSTSPKARGLLDLTGDQAWRLFFPDEPAMEEFGSYDMTADQAVARIDLFIESNGEI